MAIWVCGMLALVLLVIPFGMGNTLIRSKSLTLTLLGGLFASFCVFEVLAVIFHVTLGSLRVMIALWMVICLAVALHGWWRFRRGHRPVRQSAEAWTRMQRLLLVLVVALVLIQTLNTVLNAYYGNWDDETYCGTAVVSWYTDTVDRYAPNTGVLQPAFYNLTYNLAAWPVYSSLLAVLTGLHPAILYRTILPLFELPLAYYIAYLLLRCFWKNNRGKALLALLYFELFTLLAAQYTPQNSGEWWMVVNCWTGKALTAAIMTPLVLWLVIQLEESRQDPARVGALWRTLLFVCWAGCFISATLHFVIPVELALWGGLYLVRTRRWKDARWFLLCGMATAICALVVL